MIIAAVAVVVALITVAITTRACSSKPAAEVTAELTNRGDGVVQPRVRPVGQTHRHRAFAPMFLPPDKRTLGTSNCKWSYVRARAPMFQHELLHSVHSTLKLFAARSNPALSPATVLVMVNDFMTCIQAEAFRNDKALQHDVAAVAEYLWTSDQKHLVVNNMELCTVLNAVIRDDIAEEVQAAAPIFRSINIRRDARSRGGCSFNCNAYPAHGCTWRGGSFRDRFRDFFNGLKGKKYRVPGFLATSVKKAVAMGFASVADKNFPRARWRIRFDPRGDFNPNHRVKHMTFVKKTLIPGEGEYLFAPYSVFTLLSVKWSNKLDQPHKFTILAANDNKKESEELPLALWY